MSALYRLRSLMFVCACGISSVSSNRFVQKDFKPYIILLDGERENAIDFVRLIADVISTGVRKKFKVISKSAILAWVRQFRAHHASVLNEFLR